MKAYPKIACFKLLACFLLYHTTLFSASLPWNTCIVNDSAVVGCFNVLKHEYTFATEFELEWQGIQYTYAVRHAFNLRAQYELYNANGELVGLAKASWVPTYGLGWLYSWAADLFIFDGKGTYLGSINGSIYTDAVAKFYFRDDEQHGIAAAYMDRDRNNFIMYSTYQKKIIELKRQVVPYKTDYWVAFIYDDAVIPPLMVQFFAIFACDRQDDFIN